MNTTSCFFTADYRDGQVYYAGKKYPAGHFTVQLMNQYYKNDTAARIAVFSGFGFRILGQLRDGFLNVRELHKVGENLHWAVKALPRLTPFDQIDQDVMQAEVSDLFTEESGQAVCEYFRYRGTIANVEEDEVIVGTVDRMINRDYMQRMEKRINRIKELLQFFDRLSDDLYRTHRFLSEFVDRLDEAERLDETHLLPLALECFGTPEMPFSTQYISTPKNSRSKGGSITRRLSFDRFASFIVTDFFEGLHYGHTGFHSIDDHRFFRMIDPPIIIENMTWYEMAGYCIQAYFQTGKQYYYHGFLHYFEPTLNQIATGFMLRYAMVGHFADLKQEALFGLLEAEKHYDPAKGAPFLKYGRQYMNNRMHYYIRKMRRGCTVTSAYADRKLRTVMKTFYDHGGRNDLETICKVAEEMKIPQEEATEIIQCALLNALCTGTHRQFGSADGEWEESSEERTVSPYPEPYEALQQQYWTDALLAAWNALNYREKEMLAAHLGFCPECFSVLERTGSSEKWYDCTPRKRTPYADLAIDFGLSSPDSARRVCEHAIKKLRISFENYYACLLD